MGSTACTEPQCLYNGDFYLYLTGNIKRNKFGTQQKQIRILKIILILQDDFNP